MAMKKLYKKKGQVHPSLPTTADDHLALLPAAILTLTAALSPEDKQVLAYLLSCCSNNSSGDFSGCTKHIRKGNNNSSSNSNKGGGDGAGEFYGAVKGDHPPLFQCNCFRCYKSFWERWDASENRQLIHEIIEGYEEELDRKKKRSSKGRKERRRRSVQQEEEEEEEEEEEAVKELEREEKDGDETVRLEGCGGRDDEDGGREVDDEVGMEKGSMRRLVSFIGEKIWGVWDRGT